MLVTTNIKDRRPLFRNPVFAREAVDAIYRIQHITAFFLYGFVIMPDHCHFLLRVPTPNTIADVMHKYKRTTSFALGLGPIWQRRFHIRLPEDSSVALHYIHENPVKAGLAEELTDYPWSSACGKWDVTDFECI